jgi:hypothetical protein
MASASVVGAVGMLLAAVVALIALRPGSAPPAEEPAEKKVDTPA